MSIKYVTLILANFDPLPCHNFVTQPGTPSQKVRHTSRTPPDFQYTCYKKTRTKAPVQILSVVRGDFVRGFCQRSFPWKFLSGMVFVRSPFCQNTSVTTES